MRRGRKEVPEYLGRKEGQCTGGGREERRKGRGGKWQVMKFSGGLQVNDVSAS